VRRKSGRLSSLCQGYRERLRAYIESSNDWSRRVRCAAIVICISVFAGLILLGPLHVPPNELAVCVTCITCQIIIGEAIRAGREGRP
jgi:hypothetical protein